jgi:acyl-CoA hydrolase
MITLHDPDQLDFRALMAPCDTIVCGQGLAEPLALTRRLVAQRAELGRPRLFIGPTYSDTFAPSHGDCIDFRSYCGTGRNAALIDAGVLDVLPSHYSDLAPLHAAGTLPCDVALLQVCAPDEQGRFNLSLTHDYVVEAARRARVVVLEVNSRLPWVHGGELPDDIRPHLVLHTDREPLTLDDQRGRAGAVEAAIAQHVAARVPDGATLELGVGLLPDLVLEAMRGHRDLGVHSAVIGDGVMDLMEAGVITNRCKPVGNGVSVAGLLMGSKRLFDYAHRNPRIQLAPASVTHTEAVLGSLPAFHAINGAVEVDLGGQVNAESSAGRYIGAVGGQVDFVRGAKASPGGRSLMLLPSTARGGTVSRIVPRLADAVVTTARSDVDAIVTEYGIAELAGKTLGERARALIAVAHPDFREPLARAAHPKRKA